MQSIFKIMAGVALSGGVAVGVAGPASAEDKCSGEAVVEGETNEPGATVTNSPVVRLASGVVGDANTQADDVHGSVDGLACAEAEKPHLLMQDDTLMVDAEKVVGHLLLDYDV